MNLDIKNYSVLQVLPHLNSGGLVSGAIEISEALHKGQNIEIRGFGIFKTAIRKARIGRNPKNSKEVKIPEKRAIKWKMSRNLFNKLNKNFTENQISDT